MRLFELFNDAVHQKLTKTTERHLISECVFSYENLDWNQDMIKGLNLLESFEDPKIRDFIEPWLDKNNLDTRVVMFFAPIKGKLSIVLSKEKQPAGVVTKNIAFLNFESLNDFEKFLMLLKLKFSDEYQIINQMSINEDLRDWFKQKWVDVSRKEGGKHPACGASSGKKERGKSGKRAYPKCVPAAKAKSMSANDKKKATGRKRRSMSGHRGKSPTYAKTS
jgi:hypothetical protein